jgi:hypothetical protein
VSFPSDFATERDDLEDSRVVHAIGNATRPAPELPGRVRDKLRAQVSNVVPSLEFLPKCDLRFFKQLFPLRLWKCNYKARKARVRFSQ